MTTSSPHARVPLAAAAWAVVASCGPVPTSASEPEDHPAQARLIGCAEFLDRFAALDAKRWAISDGWSNGNWMVNDWRKSQSRIAKGLRLTLARDVVPSRAFSSGEVQSRETYGHGYYEARLRAAPGSGVVTGFFTYTGPPFGKPWNEIDVEILGARPTKLFATYFYKGEKVGRAIELGFDATRASHTYAFDWQPGSIRWFVDGKLVHKAEGGELPIPDEQQKIMFHLWASQTLTDWAGEFDARSLPTTAVIECAAYSRNKPAEDRCG